MTTVHPVELPLSRRAVAEFVGSALLAAIVVGSGIAAQSLSPQDVGLQLLENAVVTGGGLYALIALFGPLSGAHFNPVVTAVAAAMKKHPWREVPLYVAAQVVGCMTGSVFANVMFSRTWISVSTHHRASLAHLGSEVLATACLVVIIFSLATSQRDALIPGAVASYITAAYFFTSSTSFANPAITVGRMMSNSFSGINPASVPAFVLAQCTGGAVGWVFIRFWHPHTGRREESHVR